ncbi:hypothetical protein [Dinghuibacter silviterrae]|nr:hypothetical protein [Dinghuibacter silviterrae]
MKTGFFIMALALVGLSATAQVQTQIVGDSVHIHSNTGTGELRLENSTDTIPGFLFNTGAGRTQFKRGLTRIDDTTYLVGADTLHIHAASAPTITPTLASVLTAGNQAIAGTTTAPPIVMTAGPITTTPVKGAVEYDGVGFYITDSLGIRHDLTQTNRVFKIYTRDYSQTDSTLTYTLTNWNATYVSNPDYARNISSVIWFETTVPGGTNAGTVITGSLAGQTIYTLTVTEDTQNDAYVIGECVVNQDIKYPNLYYVRGATETINGAGVVTTTNTAYRMYPETFTNPTLTFTISGLSDNSLIRTGATYTVDKKQQGDWQY